MAESSSWADYRRNLDRIRAELAGLPADSPVRLRKATSNLFRPRQRHSATLDATGFDGAIAIDVEGRTADVLGMTNYEH
jgi:hypothetical protein